jgi:hypothetical protein
MTHYFVYCSSCGTMLGVVDDGSRLVRRGRRCIHVGHEEMISRSRLHELVRRRAARVEAQESLL